MVALDWSGRVSSCQREFSCSSESTSILFSMEYSFSTICIWVKVGLDRRGEKLRARVQR